MASKQPFKLLDLKQKAARLSTRIYKVVKHKILSKSRNAMILRDQSAGKEADAFVQKLVNNLKKTWEIYEVNVDAIH